MLYYMGSVWDHLGVTLGSVWGHFGITLASLWLGSLWGGFGGFRGIKGEGGGVTRAGD